MPNTYTAITKKDGDWWIGWVEEIPGVNCQESTHEQLIETLRITLKEALELNLDEEQLELAGSKRFWSLIEERRKQKTLTRAELEQKTE